MTSVLFLLALTLQAPEPGDLACREIPFEVRTSAGRLLDVLACDLTVLEDRARPQGPRITLTFAHLLSTAEEPGPPLVYLHGGPGGSATDAVEDPEALSLWEPFLELGDVILLDQRGCGRSKPSLARSLAEAAPPEAFLDRASLGAFLAEAGGAVKAELEAEGVDPAAYTTEASADDVEDLRVALGVERVRLLGFSYGTHLGLSVLRRHGERVERAVLIGVEGPDETEKLPGTYDVHLGKLSALIAADPLVGAAVPDFAALLRRVLAKLEKEPLPVRIRQPTNGEEVTLRVGPDLLRTILVRDLGDTNDLPVFPRLLWTIERGDPSVLRWFVQKRCGMTSYPTHLFTIDVASGCSPARAERITAEARTAVLAGAMNFRFPEVEAVWNVPRLGDDFRAPLVTSVPTLFLSGTLDANTPPHQAEAARWGFANGIHLVSRHGGHEDWTRNPKARRAIRDFLAGEDVNGRDVDMPLLAFLPVEGPASGHPSVDG